MAKPNILVTGALGQIGSVLVKALAAEYPDHSVISTDLRKPQKTNELFLAMDVTQEHNVNDIIRAYQPEQIYHLAALLSATGEKNIGLTWQVNFQGYLNILEAVRMHGSKSTRIFYPSTIAIYGSSFEKSLTPQNAYRAPSTMYGISKVAGENYSTYYYQRYATDIRSVRYPGIIGHQSMPGGGTTDYAVEIFHEAIAKDYYECYLDKHAKLPMMYMEDAIRATIEIMKADEENVKIRDSYNIQGCSFTPEELADEIKLHLPNFEISYNPDYRQKIAENWPEAMDDSSAQKNWGWKPEFGLSKIVHDMLDHLKR